MKVDFSLRELEVLSQAIMRLRFEDAVSGMFLGSSYLAASHERIVDSIIAECEKGGDVGRAARWVEWREWRGRSYERDVIRNYVTTLDAWSIWSYEQKIDFLRISCSPFSPSDSELGELCREIDANSHEVD
ncbi:hypothetical protein [Streptomyces boncukensis]|uniref:Uncharacterized protein n=1 Tax=Streptomyces boncukensis TaxID=2711219 RepID=A0A6G4X6K1_9ACTN|nr:hypothetical protein [Streptomyces boncukensis]NGO72374.1 hypothetical protein [Streptomyces boncukensis]